MSGGRGRAVVGRSGYRGLREASSGPRTRVPGPVPPPGPGSWVVLSTVSRSPQCAQVGTAVVSWPQSR
jgi:hypothetical protein